MPLLVCMCMHIDVLNKCVFVFIVMSYFVYVH